MQYSRCPTGFVLPDHPGDPDVQWVNGTNCAIGCRSPIVSEESWMFLEDLGNSLNIASLVCIVILFISFAVLPKSLCPLVLTSSAMSLFPTLVATIIGRLPFQDRFCRDNAVPLSAKDGLTLCSAQSFVSLYCGLALTFAWLSQVLHVYLIIVRKWKRDRIRMSYYLAAIFIPPAIVTSAVFGMGHEGYARGHLGCFVGESAGHLDLWLFFLPVFALGCIGVVLMAQVVSYALTWLNASGTRVAPEEAVIPDLDVESPKPEKAAEEDPQSGGTGSNTSEGSGKSDGEGEEEEKGTAAPNCSAQQIKEKADRTIEDISSRVARMWEQEVQFYAKLKALSTHLWFVGIYVFCLGGALAARFMVWDTEKDRADSFDDWTVCVFEHYDGVSDASWEGACGEAAAMHGVSSLAVWFAFVSVSDSLFVALSYMRFSELMAYIASVRRRAQQITVRVAVHCAATRSGKAPVRTGSSGSSSEGTGGTVLGTAECFFRLLLKPITGTAEDADVESFLEIDGVERSRNDASENQVFSSNFERNGDSVEGEQSEGMSDSRRGKDSPFNHTYTNADGGDGDGDGGIEVVNLVR